MLIIYRYEVLTDEVAVLTIQDSRTATAVTSTKPTKNRISEVRVPLRGNQGQALP